MKASSHKGPSAHITWAELACKDGTPYPAEFIKDGRVFQLAQAFEEIRMLYKKPIIIVSAYRTKTYNRKVGGAVKSQHLVGKALDLKPPKGVKISDFYDDIRFGAFTSGVRGIGRYPTFVHIDVRTSYQLVAWRGTSIKDSRTRTGG